MSWQDRGGVGRLDRPFVVDDIRALLSAHEAKEPFRLMEVSLDEEAAAEFVKLKRDPHRFTKALFDGDWAWPGRHPSVGEPIRLLRIMSGNDGVARIIARQGPMLFATPWITP